MPATAGDVITVQGYGKRGLRRGTVVEARKGVEREVLVVRWEDGHTSTFVPGTGTTIEHPGHDDSKR